MDGIYAQEDLPHSVVTFIVNVRLMEKVVKTHAGRVKVVNAASQTNTLGTIRMMRNKAWPTAASTLSLSAVTAVVSFTSTAGAACR